MSFTEKVKALKDKIDPYYSLIFMFLGFLGLLVSAYHIIIDPPDLSVKIKKEEINYPSSINDKFIDLHDGLVDSLKDKKMKSDLTEIYDYLVKTKQYWEIEITNETDNYIKEISLRINNVSNVTSYGVVASSLLDSEVERIMKSISFEKSSGVVHCTEFINLPPKSNLRLLLWGDLSSYSIEEPVFVNYDGGVGRYKREVTLEGFNGYLGEYFYEIVISIFVVFIFVFRSAVKR